MHLSSRARRPGLVRAAAGLALLIVLAGCSLLGPQPGARHNAASVVDFLYPDKKDPVVLPSVPRLTLPLRLGIAFVPGTSGPAHAAYPGTYAAAPFAVQGAGALSEPARLELMQKIAAHFKAAPYIKSIEIIPSPYLRPQGSFANLDQLRTMYDIDVIALVSYDQVRFTDRGAWSLTYWTIVGAYVVPAEKNDTQTMLDTVVVDVKSRKMLFRAPGTDHMAGRSTYVNVSEELRADSATSFDNASRQMIVNLDQQLALFQQKVKERPEEYQVVRTAEYQGRVGGGAIDAADLGFVALVAAGALWLRRRS